MIATKQNPPVNIPISFSNSLKWDLTTPDAKHFIVNGRKISIHD